MSSELDDVARSLFLGHIPNIWRKLAPDTLKSLGNWMLYFLRRFSQYTSWVSESPLSGGRFKGQPGPPATTQCDLWSSRLGALKLLTLQAYLYLFPFSLFLRL